MNNEWDIKIGTDLDTSEAEAKLKSLTDKYNDNPIEIKIDIDGQDNELKTLEKSLKNIKDLAKEISGMKIDLGGNLGKIGSDIAKDIKSSTKDLNEGLSDIGNDLANKTSDSVKGVNKDLQKEINETKKDIDSLISNFKNIDVSSIDKSMSKNIDSYIDKLGKIKDLDFKDIDSEGLGNVKNDLKAISEEFSKINSKSNDNKLKEAFNVNNIKPFIEQLENVRSVMDAKNMNLDGINALIGNLSSLSRASGDIQTMISKFNELKASLRQNITIPLNLTNITSAELAIKEILKYKEGLEKRISMTVDQGEIDGLNADLSKVNGLLDELDNKLNPIGKTTEINLVDASQARNIENMVKSVDSLDSSLDKLQTQINKLKNSSVADLDKLFGFESLAKGFKDVLSSLDGEDLNSESVSQLRQEYDKLANSVSDYAQEVNKLELREAFDVKLDDIIKQSNGLKSAFQEMGISRVEINKLMSSLKELGKVADVSLDQAEAKLKEYKNTLKEMSESSKSLGNTEGGLTQYIQTLNKLERAQKNLLKATSSNSIEAQEKQIKRYNTALNNLEKGFNRVEKGQAEMLRADSMSNLGKNITTELNKANKEITKTQKLLNKLGTGTVFANITREGGQLQNTFDSLNAELTQLKGKLSQALDSGDIDVAGVKKLQNEIEETSKKIASLSNETISINASQAIAELEQLKNQAELTEEQIERINSTKINLNESSNQYSQGTIDFSDAERTAKSASNEISKINKSIEKTNKGIDSSSKSTDGFVGKIENSFRRVGDSFSSITIGEMMEEAIENMVYSIGTTITELDSAFTEFARVAPDNFSINTKNLQGLANEAREIGISVGQSVEDVIKGMSTALQAGANNMEQATAIAKSSAIFQNVTDMSSENASKAVSSLINQYYSMDTALSQVNTGVGKNIEGYNNLTQAMDLLNYSGNNFAISSEGVSQALQRGGSVLANYGVSLVDSVAMISGANELNMALLYSNI